MGRARATIDLPVQVSAAEALWYDVQRWATFVDGFGHVAGDRFSAADLDRKPPSPFSDGAVM